MRRSHIRLAIARMACCAAGTLTMTARQGRPTPPPETPAPQGGGRGGIEQQIAAGADFLRRPPVARPSPET